MDILGGLILLAALAAGVSVLIALMVQAIGNRSTPAPPPSPANTRRGSRATQSLYRTRDGRADYSFSFEQQSNDTWQVYIRIQPDYRGRADDAHSTHRLPDGDRKYVCWSSPIRTLEEARQVAAAWADATQQYIRTGKRF